MKTPKLYSCEFAAPLGQPGGRVCRACSHNYPHVHTPGCNGDHCVRSNELNDDMKDWLTCAPIVDNKKRHKEVYAAD